MTKKRWSKIRRGDTIVAAGREWTVEKLKPGKRRIAVRIRSGKHVAEQKVDPDEKITLAEPKQTKPARERAPKPQPATPPKPAEGDPWETQQDRLERKLDKILGAHLVGEATDVDAGWYVPPVDISTVAAHMAIFHGGIPDVDGGVILDVHGEEHRRALSGERALAVSHWHTEKRPTKAAKK